MLLPHKERPPHVVTDRLNNLGHSIKLYDLIKLTIRKP